MTSVSKFKKKRQKEAVMAEISTPLGRKRAQMGREDEEGLGSGSILFI